MAEKYPDLLPPFLIDSYGYDEDNDLIRTDMEAGPARVRKRATQTPTVFSVSSKMTYTQLKIFESWIRYKINGGVEWFTVKLDTGSGLVEHMGRYVGKCSVRHGGALTWVVSGKIEVEELLVMSEEDLDLLVINNSEQALQPLSLLSAQIERSYLTLTFDGPVVYAGQGFGDAYFSLVGSIHGVVGITYSSNPSPEVLVFVTNETMTVEEDVLFNFGGQPDILEDENGVDVPAITDFVCEVLVFVEPLYSTLLWPCCDKSETSPSIACTEDEYYDGTVTRIVRTFYNQTLSNNELEGIADCGFRIATSMLTTTSIKIPKILPTGGEIHYFKVSAGFCWSQGLSQDIPYTLFHVRNAESSPIARQLRLIWNLNDRTFVLQDNGATVTPLTSSTLLLSSYRSVRDYLELTVNGSIVTLVYKKRVQTLLDYNEDITYFNTDLCSWQLSYDATLYDPVLYFGGYEYQSFASYYDLMVGDCTWANLG